MIYMNLSNITCLRIEGSDSDYVLSIMQNSDLTKTPNIIKHKNLL